jgi:hypothetical protein
MNGWVGVFFTEVPITMLFVGAILVGSHSTVQNSLQVQMGIEAQLKTFWHLAAQRNRCCSCRTMPLTDQEKV